MRSKKLLLEGSMDSLISGNFGASSPAGQALRNFNTVFIGVSRKLLRATIMSIDIALFTWFPTSYKDVLRDYKNDINGIENSYSAALSQLTENLPVAQKSMLLLNPAAYFLYHGTEISQTVFDSNSSLYNLLQQTGFEQLPGIGWAFKDQSTHVVNPETLAEYIENGQNGLALAYLFGNQNVLDALQKPGGVSSAGGGSFMSNLFGKINDIFTGKVVVDLFREGKISKRKVILENKKDKDLVKLYAILFKRLSKIAIKNKINLIDEKQQEKVLKIHAAACKNATKQLTERMKALNILLALEDKSKDPKEYYAALAEYKRIVNDKKLSLSKIKSDIKGEMPNMLRDKKILQDYKKINKSDSIDKKAFQQYCELRILNGLINQIKVTAYSAGEEFYEKVEKDLLFGMTAKQLISGPQSNEYTKKVFKQYEDTIKNVAQVVKKIK